MRRIAVIGELAEIVNLGDGGSSDVWAPEVVTILDGLRAALPAAEVVHDEGSDPVCRRLASLRAPMSRSSSWGTPTWTRVSTSAMPVRRTCGTSSRRPTTRSSSSAFNAEIAARRPVETPAARAVRGAAGSRSAATASRCACTTPDVALIRAVAEANPRTIVAIVAGSAVVMSEWDHTVPAIVQSWYAGMEGGHGLADVLLGRVDATGRLPFSVPVTEAHLPPFDRDADSFTYDQWHGWWHLAREGHEPAYPFGFGLSYTTFALAEASATMSPDSISGQRGDSEHGRAGWQ